MKGHGWVDLEMRLEWLRCVPAERPSQIHVPVGLKAESGGRSGYLEVSRATAIANDLGINECQLTCRRTAADLHQPTYARH